MKKLFALLMLCLAPTLFAMEFKINLHIEDGYVLYNIKDYDKTYESDVYKFYVHKDLEYIGDEKYITHTMVEYVLVDGLEYAELGYSVKRIYNYGVLDCKNRVFNLFTDIFVDENDKIVYSETYQLGEFVSEVKTPNTARNSVYKKVCFKAS